jgi:putative cell wall-binding protein
LRKGIICLVLVVLLFNLFPVFSFAAELPERQSYLNISPDPSASEIYEIEPNNHFSQANKISLEDFVSGNLTEDDSDFFEITFPSKGYVTLYGMPEVTKLVDVALYKVLPNGEIEHLLEADYESNHEDGFYAGAFVQSGTYLIQLLDSESAFDGEEYWFTTAFIEPDVYRIAGSNRYETAVEIAYEGWFQGADEILLATGTDFPDALAAAPLAYELDAPILLTPKNKLSNSVIEAIDELGVKKVTIIGGKGAVSKDIEDYLKQELQVSVDRIAGSDRYGTAVEIAKKMPTARTAVVVYGKNYPDALSIGPYAALQGFPILLTDTTSLPKVTKDYLSSYSYKDTYVIGGNKAISENVLANLPGPERISGKDRYETSVNIAHKFFMPNNHSSFIATGANFADALSGSVLAAFYGEPILLTPPKSIHPKAKELFENEDVLWYTILGGASAVSENVESELWSITR